MLKRSLSVLLALLMLFSVFFVLPVNAVEEDELSDTGYSDTRLDLGSDFYGLTFIELGSPFTEYPYLFGDVVQNGEITISDVSKIYRFVKGVESFSEEEKILGDVNDDGELNQTDVDIVYDAIKHDGIYQFPVYSHLISFGYCEQPVKYMLKNNGKLVVFGSGEVSNYADGTSPWYNDKDKITEIEIKDDVTGIGTDAFKNCGSLKRAVIPRSVTSIASSTFAGCPQLTIYGYRKSYAQIFANSNSIPFVMLDGPISLESCTVTLGTTSYTYDGSAKTPAVTVKDDGLLLTSGTDYSVSYSNNINAGTATATITGKGNYTGTVSKTFTINKANLSGYSVMLNPTSYTYDGTAKTPAVTVKNGTKTLTSGTDYTVAYTNNINVGTATVTITGKGNYTGSTNKSFTITSVKKVFTWGQDNWNYNNSSSQGYFKSSTYRQQISLDYLNTLKNNLTNSEYQAVFVGSWYSSAWLDDYWGGSCYGMSSTTLLAKEGLLPYSSYKSGATNLHALSYPKNDSKVSSLVTYYQMLQIKDVIQQQYRTVPYRSNSTNINEIIELLRTHSTVLVGFQKSGWGGHAILATGYEYGSWTWNGISYQGCIKICDPNSSTEYDKMYNIYFNTQSYNWTIPAYSGITSANGAKFNYIGATVKEINEGGYLSGSKGNRTESFIARIDAAAIADNRSVTKVRANNGSYVNMNTAPGDIIEDYSYVLGNESNGTIGYNLYDGTASYKVSQDSPQNLQLTIDYENCNLTAGSKAGNSVLFDQSGYIEVHGESAEYNFAMTYDKDCPTDWFAIQIKGNGADIASLKQVNHGYVLSSDSLNGVEVKANNFDDIATVSFSTNYDSVFLYEINETTIGVLVDTDSNGTYETNLLTGKSADTRMLGDVDDSDDVEIRDATWIQRHIVSLEIPFACDDTVADVDCNEDVNIMDVTAIQYYLANMKTNYRIGKIIG